jgi:hypothetical protein
VLNSEIAAVGMLNGPDEIGLNYVAPDFRFRGVSKAMVLALEDAMRDRDTTIGRLTSTQTAHAFYLTMDWEDAGPPETGHNVPGFPMRKVLRVTRLALSQSPHGELVEPRGRCTGPRPRPSTGSG